MPKLEGITIDTEIMGGNPCIRGMRVTVGTIIGLLSAGNSEDRILQAYPYLELEDIREALMYDMWRLEESEAPLTRRSA